VPSNRADDVAASPQGKGWLSSVRRLALIRLLVFFAVLLAGDIAAQLARSWVIRHAPSAGADWISIAAAVVLAALLVGLYALLVRLLERRKARELAPGGIRGPAGIILGVVLFTSVLGLLHLVGVAHWLGISARFDVTPALAGAIIAAVGEELAFRGALFRLLEEGFGTGTALGVSAAVFGLLHALNPGATATSTAAIALEAGVLLAAAYAVTRNLWFPIGMHLGWNFTEGGIFGVAVSGGPAVKGVFSVSLAGRALLTGGTFGPEASLLAIAVCLAAAVVLLVMTVRNGRWLAMRRSSSHS
jgi:uncharacterized protein